jgi:hypothetical protein
MAGSWSGRASAPPTGWSSWPTLGCHLAAAFAVWRAGGVLVTIYPSSTEAELAFAIERPSRWPSWPAREGGTAGRGRRPAGGRARRHGGAGRTARGPVAGGRSPAWPGAVPAPP